MKKTKILEQIKTRIEVINFNNFLGVVILALFSATILTSFMIALPNTEKYFPQYKYNLALKDRAFWRKTFIIQSSTTNEQDLEQTKKVLKKRLNDYHIEAFDINYEVKEIETEPIQLEEEQIEDTTKISEFSVTVQSTKDEDLISRLLTDTGKISILTLKDDVNVFEMQPEQMQDLTNYNETDISKNNFRSIPLKKDPNSPKADAIKQYIMLFKPKLGDDTVKKFLDENAGKYYIVKIGDELHPLYYGIQLYPGVLPAESEPWFITLNLEQEEAQVYKTIIYNPEIDLKDINLIEVKDEAVLLPSLQLGYILLGFIITLFVTGIVLYYSTQFEKDRMYNAMLFILSSGVFVTGLVAYLKISNLAYESWTIVSVAVLTLIINFILNLKKVKFAYRIGIIVLLTLIFLTIGLTIEGYYYYIARALLLAIPGIMVINLLSGVYLKNFNKYILSTENSKR